MYELYEIGIVLCFGVAGSLLIGARTLSLRYFVSLLIQGVSLWMFFRTLVAYTDNTIGQLTYTRFAVLSGLLTAFTFFCITLFYLKKNMRWVVVLSLPTIIIGYGLFTNSGVSQVYLKDQQLIVSEYGLFYILYSIYFAFIFITTVIVYRSLAKNTNVGDNDLLFVYKLSFCEAILQFCLGIAPDLLGKGYANYLFTPALLEYLSTIGVVSALGYRLSAIKGGIRAYIQRRKTTLLLVMVFAASTKVLLNEFMHSEIIHDHSATIGVVSLLCVLSINIIALRYILTINKLSNNYDVESLKQLLSDENIDSLTNIQEYIRQFTNFSDIVLSIKSTQREAVRKNDYSLENTYIRIERRIYGENILVCELTDSPKVTKIFRARDFEKLNIILNDVALLLRLYFDLSSKNKSLSKSNFDIKRENRILVKKNQSKDEFISITSHQLRTPLSIISLNLKMVASGMFGDLGFRQRKSIESSIQGVERMGEVIEELLEVARVADGAFLAKKEPVDLSDLIKSDLLDVSKKADKLGIKIKKSIENEIWCSIDVLKIHQVIINYIDNALCYTQKNGIVSVTLEKSNNSVIFKVIDNGIGIPREEQSKVFDKFERASNAKKYRQNGTGLGLYVCKKIIEAHGGEVIFKSKLGKGSTFGFKLPI